MSETPVELSQYDSTMNALKEALKKLKDLETKKVLQSYFIPLVDALRDESIDAFEIMQDRIEDLEDESLNAKSEKLVKGALPVIEGLVDVINLLLAKHEYIKDGDYVADADPTVKQAHINAIANMIPWVQEYRAFEESAGDDEEDNDDEEGDQEEASEVAV